jgi:hypothetical protein
MGRKPGMEHEGDSYQAVVRGKVQRDVYLDQFKGSVRFTSEAMRTHAARAG